MANLHVLNHVDTPHYVLTYVGDLHHPRLMKNRGLTSFDKDKCIVIDMVMLPVGRHLFHFYRGNLKCVVMFSKISAMKSCAFGTEHFVVSGFSVI